MWLPAIDYTDPLEPNLAPELGPEATGRQAHFFDEPIWRAIRGAAGYELRLVVIPSIVDKVLAAGRTYDARELVPPGSFLLGLSVVSGDAEGCKVQFSDVTTGYRLFSQLLDSDLITDTSDAAGIPATRVLWLDKPKPLPPPGLFSVQIVNLSATANDVQVVCWIAQPVQDADRVFTPNEYNAILQHEHKLESYVRRAGGSAATPAAGGSAPASGAGGSPQLPHLNMPANAVPFFYQEPIAAPAAGTSRAVVVSFRVPQGFKASVRRIQNVYTGPGFSEGSGDIIWTIAVDGASSPGFDRIRTTLGDGVFHDLAAPIVAGPGQLVEYLVTVANGTALSEKVICGFEGYFYPEQ